MACAPARSRRPCGSQGPGFRCGSRHPRWASTTRRSSRPCARRGTWAAVRHEPPDRSQGEYRSMRREGCPMSAGLRLERDGDVWTLWLARPDKRNALSPELVQALTEHVERAPAEGAKVLVFRGEGKNF